MKRKLILVLCCIISLSFVLTACGDVSNDEREKIQSYADPIAEDMLQALNTEDYAKFSASFNEQMLKGIPEDTFKKLCADFKEKIGDYTSKSFYTVNKDSQYVALRYKAKFSKEASDVIVRVIFEEKDGKNLVAGFFMDSPKLRQK